MPSDPQSKEGAGWGPFSLSGRRALVTGACGGIGRAIVARLQQAGAEVMATDRHATPTAELAAAVVGHAAAIGGTLDLLVNNAAVIVSASLAETDEALLDLVYGVNFRAPLLVSRAFNEQLPTGCRGSIVNIASAGGVRAVRIGSSAYGSLKAALSHATAYLARELGPAGVRVNAIAPGSIASGHDSARTPEHQMAVVRARQEIQDRTALGRLGEPDDIAWTVVFLASEAASYVTGQTLLVDGGWLLG